MTKTRFSYLLGLLMLCTIQMFSLTGLYAQSAPEPGEISRTFSWVYKGKQFKMKYSIPWKTYDFYKDKQRTFGDYGIYTLEHPDHKFIDGFLAALLCKAENAHIPSLEYSDFIIAFVQHLEYAGDHGEYPKFPVETLAEKGGDCEDTALLMAALLKGIGKDVILVSPPGHMAVAIECSTCKGQSYTRNGRNYMYVETTGAGYKPGDIPENFSKENNRVLGLEVRPDQLWVLSSSNSKPLSNPTFYVKEENQGRFAVDGNPRIITVQKKRSVIVAGEEYFSTSYSGKISK